MINSVIIRVQGRYPTVVQDARVSSHPVPVSGACTPPPHPIIPQNHMGYSSLALVPPPVVRRMQRPGGPGLVRKMRR
jgi:hypothetical protein